MASGVTEQAIKRLSRIPGSDNPADLIAGQTWDDVLFVGGTITGVAISGLPAPLSISDGGTGQTTANAALNAFLPTQTGHSGQVLHTDGTNTSWSADLNTGITQLTGDVTAGPGSGSQVATLATVNSNVGTFGAASTIPIVTANAKGLITAVSTASVVAPAGTLTGATLASGVIASSLTSVGTLTGLTMGGTLVMGTNNITSTGSLGATGTRLLKGWFVDLQVTNAIAGSITGNAATVTTNANLTGDVTSVGNATTYANNLPVNKLNSGTNASANTFWRGDGTWYEAVTPWVAYTPTFTGFGTVTGVEIWSRRNGDTLEIRGRFTAGTTTAVEARMTLGFNGTNANVTSSSTKITSLQYAGPGAFSSVGNFVLNTLIEANVGYITFGDQYVSGAGLSKAGGTTLVTTGQSMSFLASVPISGW